MSWNHYAPPFPAESDGKESEDDISEIDSETEEEIGQIRKKLDGKVAKKMLRGPESNWRMIN